ncbi:hypothetical protein Emed_001842 [Eimeria media]
MSRLLPPQRHDIPHPSFVVVDYEKVRRGEAVFYETYDYLSIDGQRINKPFIEKPQEADNHDNWIYYPKNAGSSGLRVSCCCCCCCRAAALAFPELQRILLQCTLGGGLVCVAAALAALTLLLLTGGGCKKLYRKQQNSSSSYFPDIHQVRKDGIYLYEEFLPTFGTDVKQHSRLRKRSRFATAAQRSRCSACCWFALACCFLAKGAASVPRAHASSKTSTHACMGACILNYCLLVLACLRRFDILRTSRGPFVCDVNGFSFVKSNIKYYDDCSSIIRLYFLKKLADRCARAALRASTPALASNLRRQQQNLESYLAQQQRRCPHGSTAVGGFLWLPPAHSADETMPRHLEGESSSSGGSSSSSGPVPRCLCMALESDEDTGDGVEEELRTVVVVMRHGDRRPKQKLKFLSTQPLLLDYFEQQDTTKEVKLKSPEELRDLLDRNTDIITTLGKKVAAASQGLQADKQQQSEKDGGTSLSTATSGGASGKPPASWGEPESQAPSGSETSPQQQEAASSAAQRLSPLEALKRELRLHKQLQKVLLQGDGFAGINRKIQLKPKRWRRETEATYPPVSASPSCPSAADTPLQHRLSPPSGVPLTHQQQQEQQQQQLEQAQRSEEEGVGSGSAARASACGAKDSTRRLSSFPILHPSPICVLPSPSGVSSLSAEMAADGTAHPKSASLMASGGVVAGAAAAAAAAAAVASWQEKAQLRSAEAAAASAAAATAAAAAGTASSVCAPSSSSNSSNTGRQSDAVLESCVVVAKWGGELTAIGRKQAEDLGQRFRYQLYPGDSAGLLRLHSTFRHDLKIYTSDEGRCQITSAAFTKGFLDLEGELTPILVALVIHNRKAYSLLDESSQCATEKRTLKQCLDYLLNLNDEQLAALKQRVLDLMLQRQQQQQQQFLPKAIEAGGSHSPHQETGDHSPSAKAPEARKGEETSGVEHLLQNCDDEDISLIPKQLEALQRLRSPLDRQKEILALLKVFLELIDPLVDEASAGDAESMGTPISSAPQSQKQAAASKLTEMRSRWQRIYSDWYKGGIFDSSKISDILDMIRYELIHHCDLLSRDAVQTAINIHNRIKELQEAVAAFSNAHSNERRLRLAVPIVARLIRKVLRDVTFFRSDDSQLQPAASSSACSTCSIAGWGTSLGAAAAAAAAATSEELAAGSGSPDSPPATPPSPSSTGAPLAAAIESCFAGAPQQAAASAAGRGSRRGGQLTGSPRSSSSNSSSGRGRFSSPSPLGGGRLGKRPEIAHRASADAVQSPAAGFTVGATSLAGIVSSSALTSGSPRGLRAGSALQSFSAGPDLLRSLDARCSPAATAAATRSGSTQRSISRPSHASSVTASKASSCCRSNSRSSSNSVSASSGRALGRCTPPGGSSSSSSSTDKGLRPLCGGSCGGSGIVSDGADTVVINSNDLWAHQQSGGRGKKEKGLKKIRDEQVQQLQQMHLAAQAQSKLQLMQQHEQQEQQHGLAYGDTVSSQELQHPQKTPTTPRDALLVQDQLQQQQQQQGSPHFAASTPHEGTAWPSRQDSGDMQQHLPLQGEDSLRLGRRGSASLGSPDSKLRLEGQPEAAAAAEEEEEHEEDDPHQHEVAAQIRLKEGEAHLFGIRSPWRIVRSRFYVTSASHVEALLNVLLLSHRAVAANPRNAARADAINSEADRRAAAAAAAAAPEEDSSSSRSSNNTSSSSRPLHPQSEAGAGGAAAADEATTGTEKKPHAEEEDTSAAQQFKPILDPGLRDWVGQCELHYLSHIVFRVWERRKPKPAGGSAQQQQQQQQQQQPQQQQQQQQQGVPGQRTAQQQKQRQQEEKGRYRLEIFFSTGARDGFGENFYLLERKARQQRQQQRNKQRQEQQQQAATVPQPAPSVVRQQLWQEVHQQEEEEARCAGLRGCTNADVCDAPPPAGLGVDSRCRGCGEKEEEGVGSSSAGSKMEGAASSSSSSSKEHAHAAARKGACVCSCSKVYTNRVPPYCEIAPLLPLGRSVEVGDFEALMTEVLRRYGDGTAHRARADKGKINS